MVTSFALLFHTLFFLLKLLYQDCFSHPSFWIKCIIQDTVLSLQYFLSFCGTIDCFLLCTLLVFSHFSWVSSEGWFSYLFPRASTLSKNIGWNPSFLYAWLLPGECPWSDCFGHIIDNMAFTLVGTFFCSFLSEGINMLSDTGLFFFRTPKQMQPSGQKKKKNVLVLLKVLCERDKQLEFDLCQCSTQK